MARKFKTPITIDELGSASSQALAANVDGDSQNRINIDAGGKITWGSGSATGDTTLYRSAADTLKTDDAFTATSLAVTGQFTLPTSDGSADQVITTNGSGTLTWSDVSANATVSDTAPSSPATGQIWYESDTGKTFVYYDSFWIEVGASPPASPFITDLDEDTKIQVEESSDEDKIRFDTAGSERMIIDNTGKVGIGTTSPATGLHVSSGSSIVTVENTNTNSMPSIEMKGIKNTGTAATAAILNARSAGSFTIDVDPDDTDANSASFFSVEVDGAEAMRVDSEGRVGIGTTSPSELLDIDAGTAGSVELTTTGGRTIQLTANDSEPFLSVGSTTAHSAAIMTNGVRRLTVNSSGQVGIGATNPAAELDIKGASNPEIRLQSTDSSDPFLYFGDQVDAVRGGIGMDTSANALQLRGYNNSTRLTIDSSGNVGIGTTGPQVPLHVYKADVAFTPNTSYDMLILENGTSGQGPVLQLVGPTNGLAEIGFSDTSRNHAQINYNFSTNEMHFKVNGATRLWINGTGVVHPEGNGTQDLGASTRRWKDIYATNTSIQTSDVRDKANIADVDYGLDFINGLRPVTYTWDDRNGYTGTRTHMGFVAQEVAELMGDEATNRAVWINSPSVDYTDSETGEVTTEPDSQGLRYAELMAPMVKAIQELTARIEALEAG